jgi:hypothetical protein
MPVGHNDSDSEDYDECDDWSDSDDDSDQDSDIQYAQFPEPIEFPSVRQNTIMDMN